MDRFVYSQDEALRFGPLSFPIFYGGKVIENWGRQNIQITALVVGNLFLLYNLWKFSAFVWRYFLRPSRLPIYKHAEKGSWALVTGASDGIGRAFADELIARGFNVLLHGRNQEKLEAVKHKMLLRWAGRQVDIVVADASSHDAPWETVAAKAKELPGKLTVLINNVGGVTTKPIYNPLEQSTAEAVDTCLDVNARFPIQLTRALLPTLQAATPALIINCGSTAGANAVPYLSAYSGTKGFIHSWSASLQTELYRSSAPGKVEVLAFIVGNVMSNNNKNHIPFFTIDSEDCAKGCLNSVGCGSPVTYGHWRHALTSGLMALAPEGMLRMTTLRETEKRREEEIKEMKTQ